MISIAPRKIFTNVAALMALVVGAQLRRMKLQLRGGWAFFSSLEKLGAGIAPDLMARPKGYKIRKEFERERREDDARLKAAIMSHIGQGGSGHIEEGSPGRKETIFECDCGEKSRCECEFEGGVVYQWRCPAPDCGGRRFARKGVSGWEMMPPDYSGPFEEVVGTWDDTIHLAAWWSAMPGSEHHKRTAAATSEILKRGRWLLENKVRPEDDEEYLRLKAELLHSQELVLAGYGTIEAATAKRIGAAQVRLRERIELLIKSGMEPAGDAEIARELREIVRQENILTQIWNESGDRVGFKHPKIKEKERRDALKAIAAQELGREAMFARADVRAKRHRLEIKAEIAARADKRGHTAPFVAHAKELVSSVRGIVSPDRLPEGSLVYDFARFISWEDCRTWPTMHHLVMAFAERDEVIRSVIATMTRTRRRLCTATRPVRYSPRVVHFLIHWWLNGPGRTSDEMRRRGFVHVKNALCA